MKKMLKKSLALILALTLVFGAAPLAGLVGLELPSMTEILTGKAEAATYGYLTYEINNGEVTITDCDESASGALEIPSSIEGYPVTSIGNNAFVCCDSLTNINIPDSVTGIGHYAFAQCNNLTSVTIPKNITILGYNVFSGCTRLSSVNFGVNSQLTGIWDYAFSDCDSLTRIEIPDSVTIIANSAFSDCDSLTSITVVEKNQHYSSDEYGVLFNKDKTKLIQYPIGNTRTQYTIPDSVTSIVSCAFSGCINLLNVTIPDSVISIGFNVFYNTGIYNNSSNWKNDVLYIGNHLIEVKEDISGSYSIKPGTKTIADNAFSSCNKLTSVTIPDSVTNICGVPFECSGLTSITVDENNQYYSNDEYGVLFNKDKTKLIQYPIGNTRTQYTISDSVTSIGDDAFYGCNSITGITIGNSVTSIGDFAFYYCNNLSNVNMGENRQLTSIGYIAFGGCISLASIKIPDSVTSIGNRAFYYCTGLTDVFFMGSEEEWEAIEIGKDNDNLLNATIHFQNLPAENIYNLGEETYSFINFGDSDSPFGHCFGMSVTSSGYYTGELDLTAVGGSSERSLYSLSKTSTVTAPICYYHKIQGNYVERNAIVAGGSIDLNNIRNISSDWISCVNYVKNHDFDNKGVLNIGMWYAAGGGHAVNFLYYKEVNGQQRIYAYDNNFPEVETYFYMGDDGYVHQAPMQTLSSNIIGIDLLDTEIYFDLAPEFDFKRYIYADEKEIKVEGAELYYLKSGPELSTYVMYEIPENVTQVSITPLVDNASFEYNNESYEFGEVDSKTCGVLTVLTKDSMEQKTEFEIVNAPDDNCVASIASPSTTSISYGDSIILHADVNGTLPAGARIEWTADNGNFSMSVSADGTTCKISPKSNGKTVFTATVYDKDGNVISSDTQEMTAKAGLWQKIVAFFKKIFGMTKTIPEAFNNII